MTKTKNERLTTIWKLVNEHSPENQEELLKLLHERGFIVTQATLSRDIKQLKIIKSPNAEGNYIYTTNGQNIYASRFMNRKGRTNATFSGFVSLDFSENLAVIKTRPGYAMGIASDIDQSISDIILGTIAGDDTILLISREGIEREKVKEILISLIQAARS
jgi:transcriptional regulator of arginine metabolism